MKKAILILCILSMILALAACGGGSKGAVGTWQLQSVSKDGRTVTVDDAATQQRIIIELKEGGKGTMTVDGSAHAITWDDNYLTADGESVPYSVSGDTLTMELGGMVYTFSRK